MTDCSVLTNKNIGFPRCPSLFYGLLFNWKHMAPQKERTQHTMKNWKLEIFYSTAMYGSLVKPQRAASERQETVAAFSWNIAYYVMSRLARRAQGFRAGLEPLRAKDKTATFPQLWFEVGWMHSLILFQKILALPLLQAECPCNHCVWQCFSFESQTLQRPRFLRPSITREAPWGSRVSSIVGCTSALRMT